MAITHITYSRSLPHGGAMHNAFQHLESALDQLNDVKNTMALMIDGDGTQEAHFTVYIRGKYDFPDSATAKSSWDELNSLLAKLNTDASVSSVNAAILQAINKHR